MARRAGGRGSPAAAGLAVRNRRVRVQPPDSGPLQYLRPYGAATLVGASLTGAPALLQRILVSRPMAYVAEISYALYVIHGVLSHTWLGTGDRIEKYLKRPLLFGLTFALAQCRPAILSSRLRGRFAISGSAGTRPERL